MEKIRNCRIFFDLFDKIRIVSAFNEIVHLPTSKGPESAQIAMWLLKLLNCMEDNDVGNGALNKTLECLEVPFQYSG